MDPITRDILLDMRKTADRVLTQRNNLVEYDKRRQHNREAISALKKVAPSNAQKDSSVSARKAPVERETFYFVGSCFIQIPTESAIELLEEDQSHVESQISKTEKDIKKDVEQLLLLEGLSDEYSGFDLKSFNS